MPLLHHQIHQSNRWFPLTLTNYGTLSEEAGGWNEKEVWKALRLFIADEISISPEKIAQDTPFPDGLNIW